MPLVITLVVTFLFSIYLLFDPVAWLAKLMQLTDMANEFRLLILVLAAGGFVCAWIAELRVFPWLARSIGKTCDYLWPHRQKRRKRYKILLKNMRI